MHSDPTECTGRRNRINKGHVSAEDICAMWKRSYCYGAWNPAAWADRWYSWACTWQKLECTVLQSLGTSSETEGSGDCFREQKCGRKPILVGRGKRLTLPRRKWKSIISILDLTLVDDEISARFVCPAYLPLGEGLCLLGTVEIPWALVTSLMSASCSWPEVLATWRL